MLGDSVNIYTDKADTFSEYAVESDFELSFSDVMLIHAYSDMLRIYLNQLNQRVL